MSPPVPPTAARAPRRERLAPWGVAALGVALSLLGFALLHQQLEAHRQLDFEWTAHNRSGAIEEGVADTLQALEAAGALLRATGGDDPDGLAARALDDSPWIGAPAWRVEGAAAPVRVTTGEDCTARFDLAAGGGHVTAPVDVGALARAVISRLEPRGVEVLVTDVTDPAVPRPLARYASRLDPGPADCPPAPFAEGRLTSTSTFAVADRTWAVTSAATDRFRSAEAFDGGPWFVLAGGLLLTLLMTGLLLRTAQARLLQAQAVRSSHLASLGVLAAGTAHEINNPNSAIRFNAALLRRVWSDLEPMLDRAVPEGDDLSLGGLPWDEAREAVPRLLGQLVDDSGRIERITASLRHLSRPDAGQLDERVDLAAALESAVTILRNRIERCTRRFVVDAPDQLPSVPGNRQQLEQVFINLLLNALSALGGPDEGVRVELRATDEAVRIRVEDQGCGIPPALLPRVTEPFVTTRADSGGLGLGLAIIRSIVQAHRGSLELAPRDEGGTVVTVTLPREVETP